jgi:glycosyltransferase involved in cell wall biosynthesis
VPPVFFRNPWRIYRQNSHSFWRLRITTDIAGLRSVAPPGISVIAWPASEVPARWKRNLLLLLSALRSDHLVIEFVFRDLAFFSFFLCIIPFHRCRITTIDFFAGRPRGWKMPLTRWLLGSISRFVVYFRETSALERRFRIPRSKFQFVPFKINGLEAIRTTTPRDDGYIFCGGRSRRDFATLFAAVDGTGYPVKVIAGTAPELKANGTHLEGLRVPDNVEILTGDSSVECFLHWMAGARLVVIPILPDSLTQAGIGVYLQAMALRKCVIASSGLGISDVLKEGQAIIVPAGDAKALREAIQRAWQDRGIRERHAEAGYRYAFPLGGEDRLCRSVIEALPDAQHFIYPGC